MLKEASIGIKQEVIRLLKHTTKQLRKELHNSIQQLQKEFQQSVEQLRNESQSADQLRNELHQCNEQLQKELNNSTRQLRKELQQSNEQLRYELQKSAEQLRNESLQSIEQLQKEFQQSTEQLAWEYPQLESEVDELKEHHSPCGPCKSIDGSDHCNCTELEPMQDCLEFLQAGFFKNGLYKIYGSEQSTTITVFCDQTSHGGGFITIMRRQDGSGNFQRTWEEYKFGFGDLLTEFWLGNKNIHDLTKPSFSTKSSELIIDMRIKGETQPNYAKYDTFEIGDEASKYILKISGPSGDVIFLNPSQNTTTTQNFQRMTRITTIGP